MDISGLYASEYVNATYANADGIREHFEQIIRLSPSKSDNWARVNRVCKFATDFCENHQALELLDVGSGLAVFPYAMKQKGWKCTALDPDFRAAAHAQSVAGVDSICGDFATVSIPKQFPAITLNKVLEHVFNPFVFLEKAKTLLAKKGFIYIEVPDGEVAVRQKQIREEMFIEHINIFSLPSVLLLIAATNLRAVSVGRLCEPSGKLTIYAFAAHPSEVNRIGSA
jgi:2-polyprenyl-3-methyl-5-hydroxy-6-metoxy-1,4-benzoquinol methylase